MTAGDASVGHFSQAKELDAAFDIQDLAEDNAYTLNCVKRWQEEPDNTPDEVLFEKLKMAEKLHEEI